MAKKYYVIWKGHKTGIFDTWNEAQKNIKNFPKAKYKSFSNKNIAEIAFSLGFEKYEQNKNRLYLFMKDRPILESVAVDAAFSSETKFLEYQGVYVANAQRLFYFKINGGTNNIGEFLAIVHAISFLKSKNIVLPIYSDSEVAIKWVLQKEINTGYDFSSNLELFKIVKRAENWLKTNDWTSYKILKWKTEIWGEIPADFGNK